MDEIGLKYSFLHTLYEELYGFVLLEKDKSAWNLYDDSEDNICEAELKDTFDMVLEDRINIHLLVYKKFKKKYSKFNFGKNGLCKLF